MAKPRFLSENFFNSVMFPDHVVSASEEPVGNEAFRVGTARRTSSRNSATATTANTAWWVKARCDRVRTADLVVLDRGHNLEGYEVILQGSNDNFTTTEDIVDVTLPSLVYAPSDLRTLPGTKTEEGAWLYRFSRRAYRDWRLYVPAMGADLRPKIVGLFVGLSYEPQNLLTKPFSFGGRSLIYEVVESDTAWTGASRAAQRYEVIVNLDMESWDEYDLARLHIETQMWRGRPTWFLPDQARAERSWLGKVPPGQYEFAQSSGWAFPRTSFPIVEFSPKLVA